MALIYTDTTRNFTYENLDPLKSPNLQRFIFALVDEFYQNHTFYQFRYGVKLNWPFTMAWVSVGCSIVCLIILGICACLCRENEFVEPHQSLSKP